jgi:hypothetical protein
VWRWAQLAEARLQGKRDDYGIHPPSGLALEPGCRVGDLRRLWSLCALALLAVVLLALVLSAVYSVPGAWRAILYFLTFLGPSILFATGSLTLAIGFARTLPLQLITAFAGSMIGLAVGSIVVVYVLGVW